MTSFTPELRVLLMTPFYKPYLGGTEIVVDQLASGLADAIGPHNVGICTSYYAFPWKLQHGLPHREYENGILIDRTAVLRSAATEADPEADPIDNVEAIERLVDDFQPTIIHWVGGGWHGARMAALAAAPSAQAVWTPCYLPTATSGARDTRAVARSAAAVTYQTAMERDAIVDAWGISSDALFELQPGSDRLTLPPAPAESDVRFVLSVGRIGAHKGQLELVKQWARIKDRIAEPTKLVLIGEDEGLDDGVGEIDAFVAENDLIDDVILTGWQNDRQLAEWYSRATMIASMSRLESFGMAYCEAMRAGVPVMAWETGPIREVLRSGGVVVPWTDAGPDAFGNALAKTLNNPQQLPALRRRAAAIGARRSWSATVTSALEVYAAVSSRSAASIGEVVA